MSFIAIFIALLIERFFDCSHLRYWGWYIKYQNVVMSKLTGKSPYMVLAGIVVPILLAILLAGYLVGGMDFGFVKLFFSIVVILYCFGPRNLWADTFVCLNAFSEGDAAIAEEKLKVTFGIAKASDPLVMQRQWVNVIFSEANNRVFAIVIWYAVAGLLGVVLYRLISLAIEELSVARQVKSYLDWPSVRVLSFLFALGGNYNRVFASWRSKVALGPEANEALLAECGMAALNSMSADKTPVDGSAEKEEITLLDRSFTIMLVVIAVLVFLLP